MHSFQGGVNAADHLIGGYTQILQAKGHIFPYHGGYQLIVRVLEDHARVLAHVPDLVLLPGIQATDQQAPLRGNIQGVEQLGKGTLARTVVPQHSHKLAGGDGGADLLKRGGFRFLIGIGNLLRKNARLCVHAYLLYMVRRGYCRAGYDCITFARWDTTLFLH